MSSFLDIAASYLFENLPSINESFHDESVDQAKKYIENNYDVDKDYIEEHMIQAKKRAEQSSERGL